MTDEPLPRPTSDPPPSTTPDTSGVSFDTETARGALLRVPMRGLGDSTHEMIIPFNPDSPGMQEMIKFLNLCRRNDELIKVYLKGMGNFIASFNGVAKIVSDFEWRKKGGRQRYLNRYRRRGALMRRKGR